jgi:5-methylcytosine-specific restriction protein A
MVKLATLRPRVGFVDTSVAVPLAPSLAFDDPRRGTTTQQGYGWAWQKLRLRILERDGFRCQTCKSHGILTPANQVDHILNKASGGSDDPINLQSLCKTCHAAKSKREAAHRQ